MSKSKRIFKWMKRRINATSVSNFFKLKIVDFVLIPVIALIIAFLIVVPKIKVVGGTTMNVAYNSKYSEKGYKATFLGKDISSDVKVSGSVDTTKLGEYKVTYTINKYLIPIKKTRKVIVKDLTAPVITLTGDKKKAVCPNKEYEEEGFTAVDDYDKDLTKKVKVTKGKDKITYTVSDKSGNESHVTRKLIYEDKEAPVITLKGTNVLYIRNGENYIEQGYTAIDNCEGDISNKVEAVGNVNTTVNGNYTVTYKVKDSSDNEATATRSVTVQSSIDPNSGTLVKGGIYLTFDDGPQDGTTNIILDILKEEGVKATFFVTNKGPDELIKREFDEGHVVALHTASHDYSIVYASDVSYFQDLAIVHDRVQRITGHDSRIIRFPGGSSNTVSRRYSSGIMSRLTQEVLNRGYKYFDWNVSSGDAGSTTDPNQIYANVVNSLSKNRGNVVLMHDIKTYTRDALRSIIRYGKDNGYTFEVITMDTLMVRQRVNN